MHLANGLESLCTSTTSHGHITGCPWRGSPQIQGFTSFVESPLVDVAATSPEHPNHSSLPRCIAPWVASAHPHLQVLGDEFLFTISLTCVSKKNEESMNISLSSAKTQT